MIHYDDRGGNYDFNSKSCNLFPRFVFLFFFFLTRVEIVLRIFDAIFFVSTLLHFTIRMEYMRNIGQNILENNV